MPRALLLTPVLLLACSDYALEEQPSGDGYDDVWEPDISVDPLELDFGEVAVNAGDAGAPPPSLTEVVTIHNKGDSALQITAVQLADDNAPYTIGAITSPLVQPGGSAQLAVTFAPDASGPADGALLIDSNDPDEPTVEVALLGDGVAPVIEVTPTEYDFGTLVVGCQSVQELRIANVGTAPLVVSDLQLHTASSDLSVASALLGALPATLAPDDSVGVAVTYAPHDDSADTAILVVGSNDPTAPQVSAIHEGAGALAGSNTEVFEQPIRGQADILFAVDRSGSLNDDVVNVQDNFGTFTTTLAGLDADFHVAATVEDSGCINGADLFIDQSFSASEARSTITAMINLGASYGANTERAFTLFEAALSEMTRPSGCNSGFLRDEASLHLVSVSDEPEQSALPYSHYVALFQGLKDDPDDVVLHAIGGDYPSGCATAQAYTGFYEATVATGGLFLSICATDWGAQLEALAEGAVTDLSTFELSDWPVPETLVVRVDGRTTTVGWAYDPTANAIDFERDAVPEGGSTVEIEYALFGDCDT